MLGKREALAIGAEFQIRTMKVYLDNKRRNKQWIPDGYSEEINLRVIVAKTWQTRLKRQGSNFHREEK